MYKTDKYQLEWLYDNNNILNRLRKNPFQNKNFVQELFTHRINNNKQTFLLKIYENILFRRIKYIISTTDFGTDIYLSNLYTAFNSIINSLFFYVSPLKIDNLKYSDINIDYPIENLPVNFRQWSITETMNSLLFRFYKTKKIYMCNISIIDYLFSYKIQQNVYYLNSIIINNNKYFGIEKVIINNDISEYKAINVIKKCSENNNKDYKWIKGSEFYLDIQKINRDLNGNITQSNIFGEYLKSYISSNNIENTKNTLPILEVESNNIIMDYGFYMLDEKIPFIIDNLDYNTPPIIPLMPITISNNYKSEILGGLFLEKHAPIHLWTPLDNKFKSNGHILAGVFEKSINILSGSEKIKIKLIMIKLIPGKILFCANSNISNICKNWHCDGTSEGNLLASFGYNTIINSDKHSEILEGFQPINLRNNTLQPTIVLY